MKLLSEIFKLVDLGSFCIYGSNEKWVPGQINEKLGWLTYFMHCLLVFTIVFPER